MRSKEGSPQSPGGSRQTGPALSRPAIEGSQDRIQARPTQPVFAAPEATAGFMVAGGAEGKGTSLPRISAPRVISMTP